MLSKIKKMFSSDKGPRPNVVIILLDQFRDDARDVHPVFSKLAQNGILFSQTITYAPYTLASCHATFTGMYGRQNGVDAYTKSDRFDKKGCYSVAQYLKDAGYHTRAYTFSSILIPHSGFDKVNIIPEDEETGILDSHISELNECYGQDKPFLSYLHYGEIHHDVVREVIKKFDMYDKRYFENLKENRERYRRYAQMAGDYLDKLVDHIKAKDPDDNTIIVVLTDHGSSNGERPGEKAYGTFTYDYSIKIWQYWLWPKVLPSGMEVEWQVRTIDILPTILDLLQLTPKHGKKPIMGQSLLPMIRQEEDGHRVAFSETGGVDGAYPSPSDPNIRCVRDGKWKLIHNKTTNQFELYDLENDAEESNNLYGTNPEQAELLWRQMVNYL
jgi:arylsulfatase A-like enzyme